MAQQTNLNVSPYFDDFNADNDYYKVLFKPGYPVQARELTTLQSILQNQIEKFGQHFFKEGAKVIPGNTSYNGLYYAVELQNTFGGISVSAYAEQLIGAKITGQTSGVTALVENILPPNLSERGNLTLYVSYIGSSTQNNSTQQFLDAENLTSNIPITSGLLGNQLIAAGAPFATTILNNSTSTGSSFSISDGVYFIRGNFLNVDSETLILDQYTNTPSYRIGLFVNEQIITSDQDANLQDNSQGFNNYSAPGADRLKISVSLFKKPLDDFNDNNFIELAVVENGVLRSNKTTTLYNTITEELARRTYAESGDYCVNSFDISLEDSLNDGVGNRGIFSSNQLTYSGSTPSEQLAVYKISSGKAFVRGYEVETVSPVFLDAPKPRTVKTVENQAIDYNTGPTFKLNNVTGSPVVGFGNTYVVSLRNQRVGILTTVSPGAEIGVARVYDFKLTSGSYNTSNSKLNEWSISLFDIQTVTAITLNEPIDLSYPAFIKGANSGATAFLKDSTIGEDLQLELYDKSGNFILNEPIIINGILNNRVITNIVNYDLSDVKSLYGNVGGISTFAADVTQSLGFNVGLATVAPLAFSGSVEFLPTNLTTTVAVGATTFYIDDLQNIFGEQISVGSSLSIAGIITSASVVAVGNTFVQIGAAKTVAGSTLETSLRLAQNIGLGSTIIYLNGAVPDSVVGAIDSSQSRISIAFTGGSKAGYAYSGFTSQLPIVSIGDTYVYIGAASTVSSKLTVNLSSTLVSGSTTIFIDPPVALASIISIGSSVSVGSALTDVPVSQVSSSGTVFYIGAAYTSAISATSGVAVTFSNISPLVTGAGITFHNVSQTVENDSVTFSNPQITSKVVSPNALFPGTVVKKDNLVSYTTPSLQDPFIGKVVSVGTTSIEIVGVATVSGICDGSSPNSIIEVSDFKVLTTKLDTSTDNTLYTKLPNVNVSNVDLANAVLTIRKSYTVNIQNGELSSLVQSGTNETFLPYSDTRYTLVRSDGTYENLSSNKFVFSSGGTQLQIYDLGSNDNGATLFTTLRKINPSAKNKLKNRVNSVIIDKSKYEGSGIGATTLNDGLEYGNYPYGTRVQDERICLNNSDIIEVLGVYESLDSNDPSCPTAVLTSLNGSTGTTSDLVIGEKITGQNSGAIAIVAERLTSNQISFIYKNQTRFLEGERISFSDSATEATVTTLDAPSFDISSNFTFFNGQKSTYYDYGYLTRKSDSSEPSRKIKVYFSNGYYNTSDIGDVTTINSYSSFDYSKDLKSINNNRISDIIDIRPVVSNPTLSENSRSPFEFYGRTFNQSGNSATNILASDETILTSFSYYLGRIDRIFLSKNGTFQIKYGTPADNPQMPVDVDDALEIATITLPPYLYSTSSAHIKFLDHKRYTMSDIRQLENRIKNLEYYTSLSLLETNTESLFIPDSEGLNRFKSGFFVDNFSSFTSQEDELPYKNSIDPDYSEIRPSHYTTSIDLKPGPVINADPTADLSIEPVEGINVRKTGDIITLDYTEVEWLKQQFATRSESVTPFLVSFWKGSLELTPDTDTWVKQNDLGKKIIEFEGNYASKLEEAVKKYGVDPQTGFAKEIWNPGQKFWSGKTKTKDPTTKEVEKVISEPKWVGGSGSQAIYGVKKTQVFEEKVIDTVELGVEKFTGSQWKVVLKPDEKSLGKKVVDQSIIPTMRSRNIQFVAKNVKPSTQMYAFFDGKDVTKYCIPKLLEISMISGAFQVGETVVGTTNQTGLTSEILLPDLPKIEFRVAQSNHREGAYNAPTNIYPQNPYVTGQALPATYSSTSTILNVDTYSLSQKTESGSGWVQSGMTLVGKTSGAKATITNVRLISDISATLLGCLYIPDASNTDHPKFETGKKIFTLINNQSNNKNGATTLAEKEFIASGVLQNIQENIISVKNADIINEDKYKEVNIEQLQSSLTVAGSSVAKSSVKEQSVIIGYTDPLAQSFFVDDSTGIFLTRCDIFFKTKDDTNVPVTFQLRTMDTGIPSKKVVPLSEVVLDPEDVEISEDGSVATSFIFKSPVYLDSGKEYAICLLSNSTKYSVYVSRVGETDIISQTFISSQPNLGSLFKSQNASTWEPSQWEDLKFSLYRADFINNGSVEFYNPELSDNNDQIALLMPNSLNMTSRRIRISLSSPISDSGLVIGNSVFVNNGTVDAGGDYIRSAGSATGNLGIVNPGIGFTPNAGVGTYFGVPLISVTGNGTGAVADVRVNSGVVDTATIVNGGQGYQIGDILELGEIPNMPTAINSRLSVSSLASTNQLILDNVQGNLGVGDVVKYVNSSGNVINLTATGGGNVTISRIDTENDGLHIQVNHKNHGMYFADNFVSLSGVYPDTKPTKLLAAYSADSTGEILVEDSTNFSTFENVSVASNNIGYLLIGDEIISYTNVSSGSIGGNIIRQVNGTFAKDYPVGTSVYKYELNGVSLNRINKTHNLADVTVNDPITFDSYYIRIDTSLNGGGTDRSVDSTGFPTLYINKTKNTGGHLAKASQNIPYEMVIPSIQNVTVTGTSISASIRTISSSSIDGSEIPYIDNGFETITVNAENYLDTPRMICSRVNEIEKLSDLPGGKSFNMRVVLSSNSTKISPVIDSQRVSAILTSNRINAPISNYITDNRVNTIDSDPHAFQYISKEIYLENSASSIKILLDAYINKFSQVRAFYAIGNSQNFVPIFEPFPGYNNINTRGEVISKQNSDGLSDVYVIPSNNLNSESPYLEYKEHRFTIDNLPSFRSYRIKLIMTSTSQVYVPRIKNLRVLALA